MVAAIDEADTLRFEIKELEEWRDSVGLSKVPVDENAMQSHAIGSSRDVIALVEVFERVPALRPEAERVVAGNIAARRARLAELAA